MLFIYIFISTSLLVCAEEIEKSRYEEKYAASYNNDEYNQNKSYSKQESINSNGDDESKSSEDNEETESSSHSSSHSATQTKRSSSVSYKNYDDQNNDDSTNDENCSCPENERYSKCIQAECRPLNCTQYQKPIPCPRIDPAYCEKGCVCVENFLRNEDGLCVPEEECEPSCGENEIFSDCVNGGCDARNCSQLGKPVPCVKLAEGACIKGCICEKGYLRDSNGKCVEEEKCKPICTGPNEIWVPCVKPCPPQTCAARNRTFHCPINRRGKCHGACRCIEGYLRNEQGKCVPEDDCELECPEGERYSYCPPVKCEGEFCPETRDSPQSCPIGIVCDKPRCVCEFNSHRDRNTGKCIRTVDCPPFPCDGENEHYAACESSCVPETCSTYVNNRTCPPYRIGIVVPCRPQCHCNKGYYRNADGECVNGSECEKEYEQISLEKLIRGNGIFNGKFFYEASQELEGNSIMSPISVLFPIGQFALKTRGISHDELTNVLNIKDNNQIKQAFKSLLKSFEEKSKVIFDLANLVGADKKYPFSESFEQESKSVFHAESRNFDFTDGKKTAQEINKWVEEKTRGTIKSIVKPDLFNKLTRLVLGNAVYFKGAWKKPFNKDLTKEEDFFVTEEEKVKVSMMHQIGTFKYSESEYLDTKILELPYQDENFSMLFFLPNKQDGLTELIFKLQDYNQFSESLKNLRQEKVKVYIPSMKFGTQIDLIKVLKKVNVTKIFDPNQSGITGVLETDVNLFVSDAIHKAFLSLDENGTEAGAATVITAGITSVAYPPPKEFNFKADHPFLFYITRKEAILFCARFSGKP